MSLWTSEDIAKILIQLDVLQLPFKKYSLCQENGKLHLLGRGGSADVFEAKHRPSNKKKYAIKVIGFRNQNVDSAFFNESVEVQREIGLYKENVVQIYDHTELWVTLDEKDNVISAVQEKPADKSRTTIQLQFIVMEKVASVITRTKAGNIKMMPESLAYGDEQEILRLAYDIGQALKLAHDKNVLHRDVKLENVFYSEKQGQYKLGDFGIAKKTENGFAGTIAFTKGYAAPEVHSTYEHYDNTADIYSFGMMLYVLANGLKFPDSKTYNVDTKQYTPGYVLPKPEGQISDELYALIVKACRYNPDDRYQSMDEVLSDIEKILYGQNYGYKKEHKETYFIVGIMLLAVGVALWKLTLAPDLVIQFSFWEYVFLGLCLLKGVLKVFKKNNGLAGWGVLGVGIYLLIATGFSWDKLILLLWMWISSGGTSGYFALSVFVTNFISLIQQASVGGWQIHEDYGWVAITVISIGAIFLVEYEIMSANNRETVTVLYKKFFWILMCLTYASYIMMGLSFKTMNNGLYERLMGIAYFRFLETFDCQMVGLYGLVFCLFWILREQFLQFREGHRITK